jgi:hypothetical protein
MRVFLLLVIFFAVLPQATADAGKRKHHHTRHAYGTVIVTNHTGWPEVAQTVNDFRSIMPPRGPNLMVVEADVLTCDGISTCLGFDDHTVAGFAFYGDTSYAEGGMLLQPTDDPASRRHLICHELMHILTHIEDDYSYTPNGLVWGHPGIDSCVWNTRETPGAFDIQELKKIYGGKGKKHH